jgi:adenosylcobinamide-phosphate synthase
MVRRSQTASSSLGSSWSPTRRRLWSAAAGIIADQILGEPPIEPHPVAAFGTVMHKSEDVVYDDTRVAGVIHAMAGLAVGVGAGAVIRSTVLATYLSVAQKALSDAAKEVAAALHSGDLESARQLLPTLVGRDPTDLSEPEIARAVVESVAENTVDALVAPALWAAAAGAPGTLAYRAVNTMDASVGHRNDRYERYGWASARLDDIANLIPARLTAVLVLAARPRQGGAIWRAVRRDAPAHPSPNAGVAEAAFAAALGLRLGGVNTYGALVERRATLGDGRAPAASDIQAAVTLSRDVTYALTGCLIAFGAVA